MWPNLQNPTLWDYCFWMPLCVVVLYLLCGRPRSSLVAWANSLDRPDHPARPRHGPKTRADYPNRVKIGYIYAHRKRHHD